MHHHPELSKCLDNPGLCFEHPRDVVQSPAFNRAEKLQILEQWALDIRECLIAEEENMPNKVAENDDFGAMLSDIMRAIEALQSKKA